MDAKKHGNSEGYTLHGSLYKGVLISIELVASSAKHTLEIQYDRFRWGGGSLFSIVRQ